MILEELHEADVLWPDTAAVYHHHADLSVTHFSSSNQPDRRFNSSDHDCMQKKKSTPIAIPRMMEICVGDWWEDEADKVLEERVVPPHILASRREIEKEMAFSICGGIRWREQSFLRDEILRMTGFLES